MDRSEFESASAPIWKGLREFEESLGFQWLVRDNANEIWIWSADRMAHVKAEGDMLECFSSFGASASFSDGTDALEFVFGVFSAEREP